MNRRGFLIGLAATAVATVAIPAFENKFNCLSCQAAYDQWLKDSVDVFSDYYSNLVIYGRAAMRQTDQYPYVESVDPFLLEIPPQSKTAFQGLLPRPKRNSP